MGPGIGVGVDGEVCVMRGHEVINEQPDVGKNGVRFTYACLGMLIETVTDPVLRA